MRVFLYSLVAVALFMGLSRANPPRAQRFVEVQRDRVETRVEYVPVQRDVIVRNRQLVPVADPVDYCAPAAALADYGVSRGRRVERSFFFQRSVFR